MTNPTLFQDIVEKYFGPLVGQITEKFNDRNQMSPFLHKTMLLEEQSADMTWGSTVLNRSIVAADVVALGSTLPLKKRSVISAAAGSIPKLGMKMWKDEKAISDIQVLALRGAKEAELCAKIFDDVATCIKGIDVRKEIMFLQALSTGVCLVEGEGNTGTAIRADFGYKAANSFKTTTAVWSNANAKPIDDIRQLFTRARQNGTVIAHVYLSENDFNRLRNSEQGKLLFANYNGTIVVDKTLLAVPTRERFLEALKDEFKATFHIIDSSFTVQKADGTNMTVTPWEEGKIVATATEQVGRLVYSKLVEESNPVPGVIYQPSGSHILVSKFSMNEPLREFTSAQAMCLPVIDGADGIYTLDCNKH